MRRVVHSVVAVGAFVALAMSPGRAAAQEAASIVGVVQDTSGAVLPGVTIEAASPALIEKVRTAVSDGSGRFAIIGLRPGEYVVTFTLTGFKTVRREGVLLAGAFAATVNANLDVGALEETITVTGASPVVDLQSTQNQFVVNREVLDVLPATRSMQGGASLVPGVSFYAQGFVSTMSVHGSATADQRVYQDGMRIGQNLTGTGSQGNGTGVNDLGQEELVYDAGGQSAETALGGVRMDSIPKEGGNRFSGSWRSYFSNGSLQQDNVPDDLRQFIREGDKLDYNFNNNATFGGPIRKDKLWFFGAFRLAASDTFVGNMYFPDGSRVNRGNRPAPHGTARLTGQLSQNNKLRVAYYNSNSGTQRFDVGCIAGSGNQVFCTSPEASYDLPVPISHSGDLKWTSTVTNRLLLEVAQSYAVASYRFNFQPENGPFDVQNRNSSTGWRTVASATPESDYVSTVWNTFGTVSYVTGSHTLKAGMNHEWGQSKNRIDNHVAMSILSFSNSTVTGLPVASSVTVRNTPTLQLATLNADTGVFAQDRWTKDRLTLFGGGRFDYFEGSYPDGTAPANAFVPARTIEGKSCQPCWKDWSIRFGASFDLFGNGKTALKTSIGKFLAANALGLTVNLNPLGAQSDTRTWTDLDGNGRAVNLDGSPQFAEIGPTRNANFGLPVGSTRIAEGLPRGNNWEETISVQHEVFPNVSVTAGYYRRHFNNLQYTDNLDLDPDLDFTPFTIVGPSNPNLPGGGGETIPIYNLNDNKRGVVNNVLTWSTNNTRVYNGFEVSFNARLGRGFLFGGVTTERTASDSCTDLNNSNPNNLRFCQQTPPFRSLYKTSGSYRLPYDIQVGGSFQARPGIQMGSDYTVTPAIAGRPLTGGVASVTVNLADPTQLFYGYVFTNDLTASRVFRFGPRRIRAFAEVFNLMNSSTIFTRNETYSAVVAQNQWYNPIALVESRRLQFGFQLDF
jgi:hypothetical protein